MFNYTCVHMQMNVFILLLFARAYTLCMYLYINMLTITTTVTMHVYNIMDVDLPVPQLSARRLHVPISLSSYTNICPDERCITISRRTATSKSPSDSFHLGAN